MRSAHGRWRALALLAAGAAALAMASVDDGWAQKRGAGVERRACSYAQCHQRCLQRGGPARSGSSIISRTCSRACGRCRM